MLELRPNCEYCDKDLPPEAPDARICSYECTFCAGCVETRLHNVCPNCGGGFVPRPIRPSREWRPGVCYEKQVPSTRRVHLKWPVEDVAAFVAEVREVEPGRRSIESCRPGEAMGNGNAHVGAAELRDQRAVTELDEAVHDRLGMHKDVDFTRRKGEQVMRVVGDMGYVYRHSAIAEGSIIWLGAIFQGRPEDPTAVLARMDEITARRETTQPIREKTGGSTFKNPPGHSAWKLVDEAGWRGKAYGGAMFSPLHANFLINSGEATAADLEGLGEAVRADVKARAGVDLQWEVKRIGRPDPLTT